MPVARGGQAAIIGCMHVPLFGAEANFSDVGAPTTGKWNPSGNRL
jgi:hypothetical protein